MFAFFWGWGSMGIVSPGEGFLSMFSLTSCSDSVSSQERLRYGLRAALLASVAGVVLIAQAVSPALAADGDGGRGGPSISRERLDKAAPQGPAVAVDLLPVLLAAAAAAAALWVVVEETAVQPARSSRAVPVAALLAVTVKTAPLLQAAAAAAAALMVMSVRSAVSQVAR